MVVKWDMVILNFECWMLNFGLKRRRKSEGWRSESRRSEWPEAAMHQPLTFQHFSISAFQLSAFSFYLIVILVGAVGVVKEVAWVGVGVVEKSGDGRRSAGWVMVVAWLGNLLGLQGWKRRSPPWHKAGRAV
jgi:hypothetical protein